MLRLFLDGYDVSCSDTEIPLPQGGTTWIHSVELPGSCAVPPLVWLPGYGTGAAIFAPTWKHLLSEGLWAKEESSARPTLIAVDLLGCYLSGRPPWTCGLDPEKAEKWFVDGLEAWRSARHIESMDLLGHSLGGNVAMCYAESHPERVRTLVLVSPAGLKGEPDDFREKLQSAPRVVRLLMDLWRRGWTPGDGLRLLPRRYARRICTITATRWARGYEDDGALQQALADYLTHGWLEGRRSGEVMMNALLHPGAWGKRPLGDRLPKLRVRRVEMVYGELDWMDVRHGNRAAEACLASAGVAPAIWVQLVAAAGHYVHLENVDGFADALHKALSDQDFNRLRTADVPASYAERWSGGKAARWRSWEGYDFGR